MQSQLRVVRSTPMFCRQFATRYAAFTIARKLNATPSTVSSCRDVTYPTSALLWPRHVASKSMQQLEEEDEENENQRNCNTAIRCSTQQGGGFHSVRNLVSPGEQTVYHYTSKEGGDAISRSGEILSNSGRQGKHAYTTGKGFETKTEDLIKNNYGSLATANTTNLNHFKSKTHSVFVMNAEEDYVPDARLRDPMTKEVQDIKITPKTWISPNGIGLNKVSRWEKRDAVTTDQGDPVAYVTTESGSNIHVEQQTGTFASETFTTSEHKKHGWLIDTVTKTESKQSNLKVLGMKIPAGKTREVSKEQGSQLSANGSALLGGVTSAVTNDILTRGTLDRETAKMAAASGASSFAQSSLARGIESVSNCSTSGAIGATAITEVVTTAARGGTKGQVARSATKAVVRQVVTREAVKQAGKCALTRTGYVAAGMAAVESVGHIADYAQGKIDGEECAKRTAKSATVAGGAVAGAEAGAALGTVLGPVGTVVGGVVGGIGGSLLGNWFWS